MHLVADTHTHTIASGHAYSSLTEMFRAAAAKGLEAVAVTDHGPAMPDGAHHFYFHNMRIWPDSISGVRLLKGAEVNITEPDGSLDLPGDLLARLDCNIASIHPPAYSGADAIDDITRVVVAVMQNPYIHVIGHPDDGRYPVDFGEIARAAADTGTLLEVNNNSLRPDSFRVNARENCIEMLEQCEKYGAMVTAASDAHIDMDVGNFTYALSLLEETGFPEALVANTSMEKLWGVLKKQ
jgi:putative hydrolase